MGPDSDGWGKRARVGDPHPGTAAGDREEQMALKRLVADSP
jgi:hypothetical protein